ncbi:hypothetical protein KVA01_24910 [Kocuria varians]|uniref:Uncharacterized protein n=1 Tax=Kocuria varians TaxID=1272 RepID=A0A4Y4D6R9_KOCVA|nr:hypothetical protein KVA01_24910 [Kocuria varians]
MICFRGSSCPSPRSATIRRLCMRPGGLERNKRGVWMYYRTHPVALEALGTLFAPEEATA